MNNTYNRILDLVANNRNDEETALQRNDTKKSYYYSAEPKLATKDRKVQRKKLANELKDLPKSERPAHRREVASSHPLGTAGRK
tara:strand:- start:5 stop:256 length:252 start_codon:yes stop_codon:yes gene_type:complete